MFWSLLCVRMPTYFGALIVVTQGVCRLVIVVCLAEVALMASPFPATAMANAMDMPNPCCHQKEASADIERLLATHCGRGRRCATWGERERGGRGGGLGVRERERERFFLVKSGVARMDQCCRSHGAFSVRFTSALLITILLHFGCRSINRR